MNFVEKCGLQLREDLLADVHEWSSGTKEMCDSLLLFKSSGRNSYTVYKYILDGCLKSNFTRRQHIGIIYCSLDYLHIFGIYVSKYIHINIYTYIQYT